MPTRSPTSRAHGHARALPLALALLCTLAAASSASAQARPAKSGPRYGDWARQPLGIPVAALHAAFDAITESEPNNTAETANPVNIGDEVSGVVDPEADVDVFSITLTAGASIDVEVFAQRDGSPLDSYLEIYDGTNFTLVAANDDAFGLDSRIRYTAAQPGTYLIVITDLFGRGGPTYTYRLRISQTPSGPGDPTTIFTQGLQGAWSTAAGVNELFVVEQNGGITRVAADGTASLFASNVGVPYDVAIDGFGRVLVAGQNNQNRGIVTAIDRVTNERTSLIASIESAVSITVGPDGDLYVANSVGSRIHRYDPRGVPKETIDIAGTHGSLIDLAFSPLGELHYSNVNNAVYRIVNGRPVSVISSSGLGGLAFDRDGNIYLGTAARGITLYSAAYQLLNDPFASSGLTLTGNVVFGRDAQGAMTTRLFAVNLGDGTIREVNRAGVRAPGFRIGVDLLLFAADTVRRGVMGGEYADTLRIIGIPAGLTWAITEGTLPAGVSLAAATGVLSGIPQVSGTYTFSVRAEGGGRIGIKEYTLTVIRPVVNMGAASDHLLGVPNQLTPALERFLDLQGNRNGRFDIGDLRAYLRAQAGGTSSGGSR
ncbi:MAG TPA: pre-peptidase C-terminal domain-containing protein [Longimicrobiales bacterium]|nr:pre-peptidase C-terminal domain-containing protein [Longimicrobiales bacterium]